MTALTVRGPERRAAPWNCAPGRTGAAWKPRCAASSRKRCKNWRQEVLSIAQRNGVPRENHDALAQALSEADKPIEEPAVFAK